MAFLMPRPFIAAGREELVELLGSQFERVGEEGKPRLVDFHGGSGLGKTRVAQEFYERIAERQEEAVWPSTLVPPSAQRGELRTRRPARLPGALEGVTSVFERDVAAMRLSVAGGAPVHG
jgi:hypothetical protein